MNIPAPSPTLGFSVGIVGHKADRITDRDKVRHHIDGILGAVQAALDRIAAGRFYAAGRHPLRLVSALAEGADRIAAEAALDLGQVLEVILPFVQAEYEADSSSPAATQEFRALLARASSVIVLEGAETERWRAYEAAGYTLLDNTDLLIAVWDGAPGRGRGGTRDVIEQAAHRAMPVVVIAPDGSSVMLHGGLGSEPMRFEDLPVSPVAALPDAIAAIVGSQAETEEGGEWRALADMPPNPFIHGAYPLLLKAFGLIPWRRPRRPPAPDAPQSEAACRLNQAFEWWDSAAIRAAQAFRSAVTVNFALAALAVVLAATSLLFGHVKWLFVLAEIITIVLLLLNTLRTERFRWHERWIESRQVAELLRVGQMLRSVGISRGIADPGQGGSNGWYASAIARSCPMLSVDLSQPAEAAAPLIAEVRSQADWNAATAKRMHQAAHRIEKFGEVLFVIVLAGAVGWLLVWCVNDDLATSLKYALTAATAGLPAVATASYGVRVIVDFEGVGNRAQQMALRLNDLLGWWERGPKNAVTLQETARRAGDIMLSDVAAWRLLAEGRRLTIPG